MRILAIGSLALLLNACGASTIIIENIIPVEGPLRSTMFTIGIPLDPAEAGLDESDPLEGVTPNLEVDVTRGYCVSQGEDQTSGISLEEGACFEEPFAPHYAILTVANWNEVPGNGGTVGQAQFERYTASITKLDDDAPDVAGFSGLLGFSIEPQHRKSFALVLVGMDAKAEFRTAGLVTPRRYAVKLTLEGPGGLTVEGSTTVVVGDFSHCGGTATGVPFCSVL